MGSTVVIRTPGPGGEEKLPSSVSQLPKAVGLSGCMFLPLSLSSGASCFSW